MKRSTRFVLILYAYARDRTPDITCRIFVKKTRKDVNLSMYTRDYKPTGGKTAYFFDVSS